MEKSGRGVIMKRVLGLLVIFFFWLGVSAVLALTVNVDGNLSDWGLSTAGFVTNGNNWDPGLPGVYVAQEDWVGSGGYVGPGWGYQNYDIEAILVTSDATNLYIAIASGFPPFNNGHYDPGDIAIDLGADGSYDYAFVFYPDGRSNIAHDDALYQVLDSSAWQEVYYSQHSESDPYRLKDVAGLYQYIADGSFAYTSDSTPRYLMEVSIPWSALGGYVGWFKVHWTMECGNDHLEVTAYHTPEPASILLLGSAFLVIGLPLRYRIRKK